MPQRITDAEQALDVAAKLAPALAAGASDRDRERRLPRTEVDLLSDSGLLAITVPHRYGGAEVDAGTLSRVVALLAAADPNLAQIPHSHFVFLDALARGGSATLQETIFAQILAGARLANAQTERSSPTVRDDATRIARDTTGTLRLTGTKYYCTGSPFADLLAVRAVTDGAIAGMAPGRSVVAYLPADHAGVSVTDDWHALGQRTTGSGTVTFDDVVVEPGHLIDFTALIDVPSTYGARAQLLHAAIDTGIARGALAAANDAADRARPWFEAGVSSAADDPLLIAAAGDLELAVRSAEALLTVAAERIEDADRRDPAADVHPDPARIAEASLATAAAKVAAGRAARRAGAELFDFGGTRAAAESANLSRYWRDARTHTLHDPERWKLHHLGRWALSRHLPPSHGAL